MYKLVTKDGDIYCLSMNEAKAKQKYLGGTIVSIH